MSCATSARSLSVKPVGRWACNPGAPPSGTPVRSQIKKRYKGKWKNYEDRGHPHPGSMTSDPADSPCVTYPHTLRQPWSWRGGYTEDPCVPGCPGWWPVAWSLGKAGGWGCTLDGNSDLLSVFKARLRQTLKFKKSEAAGPRPSQLCLLHRNLWWLLSFASVTPSLQL